MMTNCWCKVIPSDRPWPPQISGCFFHDKSHVFLIYVQDGKIVALSDDCSRSFLTSLPAPSLPEKWVDYQEEGKSYLLLSNQTALNISEMQLCSLPSSAAKSFYNARLKESRPGDVLWRDTEYCLKAHGEGGCLCEQSGKEIWRFSGRAYRYTPFVSYQKHIILWGTAGYGGYLYIMSLKTGKLITEIKTGGTAHFVQEGDFCYVIANSPNAKLLRIDIMSGRIMESIDLKGKAAQSPLTLIADKLHTVTYQYQKDGSCNKAIWQCISL